MRTYTSWRSTGAIITIKDRQQGSSQPDRELVSTLPTGPRLQPLGAGKSLSDLPVDKDTQADTV